MADDLFGVAKGLNHPQHWSADRLTWMFAACLGALWPDEPERRDRGVLRVRPGALLEHEAAVGHGGYGPRAGCG